MTILASATSDDLGGRIWGHPVPLNRGRWATLDEWMNPEKWLLLWFLACQNKVWPLLASEVTEADLNMPMTSAPPRPVYMPNLVVLGWKLWICIRNKRSHRRNWFGDYIIRLWHIISQYRTLLYTIPHCLTLLYTTPHYWLQVSRNWVVVDETPVAISVPVAVKALKLLYTVAHYRKLWYTILQYHTLLHIIS